ncbi:MAG: hypothetical protein KGJ87_00985 [Planctomycetota bacterium]|nr:hypothetical protein [Planctomycetota bacterium]MDE2215730.1 hypothetical protein [Planctomycetota bacterium]
MHADIAIHQVYGQHIHKEQNTTDTNILNKILQMCRRMRRGKLKRNQKTNE